MAPKVSRNAKRLLEDAGTTIPAMADWLIEAVEEARAIFSDEAETWFEDYDGNGHQVITAFAHGPEDDPAWTIAAKNEEIAGAIAERIEIAWFSRAVDCLKSAVSNAQDLDELKAALNTVRDCGATVIGGLEDIIDLDELPTFGGDEPADLYGIVSWDDSHMLAREPGRPWKIIGRDDRIAGIPADHPTLF